MLSRTADHLYWMARYIERAENMAVSYTHLDVYKRQGLDRGSQPDSERC